MLASPTRKGEIKNRKKKNKKKKNNNRSARQRRSRQKGKLEIKTDSQSRRFLLQRELKRVPTSLLDIIWEYSKKEYLVMEWNKDTDRKRCLLKLDPDTMLWTPATSYALPPERMKRLVSFGSVLYGLTQVEILKFDPLRTTWLPLATLPRHFWNLNYDNFCVVDDTIYIFGKGQDAMPTSGTSAICWDQKQQVPHWERLPSMLFSRQEPAVVAVESGETKEIYIIGGITQGVCTCSSTETKTVHGGCEIFDIKTRNYREGPKLHTCLHKKSAKGFGTFNPNQRIIVFSYDNLRKHQILDLRMNQWSSRFMPALGDKWHDFLFWQNRFFALRSWSKNCFCPYSKTYATPCGSVTLLHVETDAPSHHPWKAGMCAVVTEA